MNRLIACPECDDPMAVGPTGWGRCRSCGHETLRDADAYSRDERAYVDASVAVARSAAAGLVSFIDK